MSLRLRKLIVCWFVVQILLPFTAPLQTLDLSDLFGSKHNFAATSPESTSTPTMSEASDASAAVPVLAHMTVHIPVVSSAVLPTSTRDRLASTHLVLSTSQEQRSVLRL